MYFLTLGNNEGFFCCYRQWVIVFWLIDVRNVIFVAVFWKMNSDGVVDFVNI